MYDTRPFSKDNKSQLYLQMFAPKFIQTAHMLLEQCLCLVRHINVLHTHTFNRLDRILRLLLRVKKRGRVVAVSLSDQFNDECVRLLLHNTVPLMISFSLSILLCLSSPLLLPHINSECLMHAFDAQCMKHTAVRAYSVFYASSLNEIY